MIEITMDGPGKNSLGTPMMEFVIDRLTAAAGEAVLLTGSGDAFSAGLNLLEVSQLSGEAMEAFLRKLELLCSTLYRYPGPTVALVNGHAIAGGCILTLCCDYRVATTNPKTRIGLNEVALGLSFPPFIFSLVKARIPAQYLETVVLGAALYSPQEALRLSLLDDVSEEAGSMARARLEALAKHPPDAYARVKASIRGTRRGMSPEEESYFRESVLPLWTSPQLKEKLLSALRR